MGGATPACQGCGIRGVGGAHGKRVERRATEMGGAIGKGEESNSRALESERPVRPGE